MEPMIHHNFFANLLLVLAILSATSVAAFATPSTTLDIYAPVRLNGELLSRGTYKLTWVARGPEVAVRLIRNGKVIATAEGRLVERDLKYNRSAVIHKTNPDGTATLIEIRLAGKKQAIVFDQ